MLDVSIIIPTFNGGDVFKKCIDALLAQEPSPKDILIIDSGSTDLTLSIAKDAGIRVHSINQSDFNHGATRNLGIELSMNSEFVVFLTQDAILETKQSIADIYQYAKSNNLAGAYGRQLPHEGATLIESHARIFNYGSSSLINSKENIPDRGIKTAYCSNSFSIYNRKCLSDAGMFPPDVIYGEDMYVAAKMILSGNKVGYCAEAVVKHSHSYTLLEEFKRYFDVGVFHLQASAILSQFNGAQSEGRRFVVSESKYLIKNKAFGDLIESWVRTLVKFFSYKLGQNEARLPRQVKQKLSMNSNYWAN